MLFPGFAAQQGSPLIAGLGGIGAVEGGQPARKALINELIEGGSSVIARGRGGVRAPTASLVQVRGQVPQCEGDSFRLLHGVMNNTEQTRAAPIEQAGRK